MGNIGKILTPEMMKELEEGLKRLKNNPPSYSYWEEHEKEILKLREEREKLHASIQMSYKTYHEPFTI